MSNTYSIGQYIGNGSDETKYIESKNFTGIDILSNISGGIVNSDGSNTENYFRDKGILLLSSSSSSENFKKNTKYHFFVKIEKNFTYDINYNIKLVETKPLNSNNSGNTFYIQKGTDYQYLKRVTVLKGINNIDNLKNNTTITFFTATNGEDFNKLDDYDIYYAFGKIDANNKLEVNVDLSSLLNDSDSKIDNYDIVEIIFEPKEDKFNTIIIEKERTTTDYISQFKDNNNNSFSGIKTDIIDNKQNLKLNEIKEIKPKDNIQKLGVWGRNDLLFCLNGQGIRIGPRGYYELDLTDSEITLDFLGVVVEGENDNFLIDYEYISS